MKGDNLELDQYRNVFDVKVVKKEQLYFKFL